MAALEAGAEIDGRYRVLDRSGSGSMGVVFRAQDIWLDRTVAVKMVDQAYAGDQNTAKYFVQEARALAQIRHDNVVHVYTFGQHEGTYYFAMEFVDGTSLEQLIDDHAARGEYLDIEQSLKILRAVGRGLAAVHERNLVHRDVKPANVVIENGTGRPVLVDFGLARRARSSNPRATSTAGTPQYMAPEQARDVDGTQTTSAADLYALACTAFELFVGRPLFTGADIYEVLLQHLKSEPPKVSSVRPELGELDPIFDRALDKDPLKRHTSVASFVGEVEYAIREVNSSRPPIRFSRTPPPMPAPGAIRLFLLEVDDGLARQITRAAEKALDVPAVERFTSADDLLAAFERFAAEIVILDDDTSGNRLAAVIERLRGMNRGTDAEVIVLSRAWESTTGVIAAANLAELGAKELPKPINLHVLGSVMRSAGVRSRARISMIPM